MRRVAEELSDRRFSMVVSAQQHVLFAGLTAEEFAMRNRRLTEALLQISPANPA
jgi:hypothetical protein